MLSWIASSSLFTTLLAPPGLILKQKTSLRNSESAAFVSSTPWLARPDLPQHVARFKSGVRQDGNEGIRGDQRLG
jgi:hypothetical protein